MMATCNLGHWVVDNLAKLSKIYSLWNVLQLIFCEILPKATKIWLSGGRLGTCHQIQAFQGFS